MDRSRLSLTLKPSSSIPTWHTLMQTCIHTQPCVCTCTCPLMQLCTVRGATARSYGDVPASVGPYGTPEQDTGHTTSHTCTHASFMKRRSCTHIEKYVLPGGLVKHVRPVSGFIFTLNKLAAHSQTQSHKGMSTLDIDGSRMRNSGANRLFPGKVMTANCALCAFLRWGGCGSYGSGCGGGCGGCGEQG